MPTTSSQRRSCGVDRRSGALSGGRRSVGRWRLQWCAVNRAHALICSSGWWSGRVERELLPWALADLRLGEDVLEIGPGFGATTRVLARRGGQLSVAEIDPGYCERLRRSRWARGRRASGCHRAAVRGRSLLRRGVLHDAPPSV